MLSVIITVPCFNEADRLDLGELARLCADPRVRLLFIDDGSSDRTREVLAGFVADHEDAAALLALDGNRGKGEAVRMGLVRALGDAPDVVGYIDADLATPVDEVLRLVDELGRTGAGAVIGARVAHLGADIRRRHTRHYVGRLFATIASLALDVPVYDTQCGAKLFRNSAVLQAAVATPFVSRWAFDVELLGRLLRDGVEVVEVPLRQWHDISGSKLKLASAVRAALDVVRIGARLRRRT